MGPRSTDRSAGGQPWIAPTWRGYQRPWLRADVVAGVTVAAYLIPQVLAYATVAGLQPAAGLWAAVAPLVVYALLGTSRLLSAGPESSTALMTAASVATIADSNAERAASVAAALALAVGVVCLIGWLLRAGFVADLLSKPVLIGYMAGIAVLMIAGQLGKILGFEVEGERPLAQMWFAVRHLGRTNWPTLIVATSVLIVLLVALKLRPHWPTPLLAMIGAAVVTSVAGLERRGVALVGTIPRRLPTPALPLLRWDDVGVLVPAAVGLAVVGYTDNVLTARAFRQGEQIDTNRELLALGAANVAAAFSRSFPVSSSGSRTAIARTMRARTQVVSVATAVAVVLALLFAAPALSKFPMAALGGVVVYAALQLIELGELHRIERFRRSELVLAGVAFAGVLLTNVLVGIGVAVGLSILDLLRRVARPHSAVLGFAPGLAGMHDVDDYPDASQVAGLVVFRWDSPLFFANAQNFLQRALAAVDEADQPVRWFVLNAEALVEIDLTGADALEELRVELSRRDIVFAFARLKYELAAQLRTAGLLARIGDRVYPTLPTSVEAYRADTGRG